MLTFKQFLIEEESAKMQLLDVSPQTRKAYEDQRKREKELRQKQNLPADPDLDISFDDRIKLLKRDIERDLTWGISIGKDETSDDTRYPTEEKYRKLAADRLRQTSSSLDPYYSAAKDNWNKVASILSKEYDLAIETAKQWWKRQDPYSTDVRLPGNIQSKDERDAGIRYRPLELKSRNEPSDEEIYRDDYYTRYANTYPELFSYSGEVLHSRKNPDGTTTNWSQDLPRKEAPGTNIQGYANLFSPEEMEKGIQLSSGLRLIDPKEHDAEMKGLFSGYSWVHPFNTAGRYKTTEFSLDDPRALGMQTDVWKTQKFGGRRDEYSGWVEGKPVWEKIISDSGGDWEQDQKYLEDERRGVVTFDPRRIFKGSYFGPGRVQARPGDQDPIGIGARVKQIGLTPSWKYEPRSALTNDQKEVHFRQSANPIVAYVNPEDRKSFEAWQNYYRRQKASQADQQKDKIDKFNTPNLNRFSDK